MMAPFTPYITEEIYQEHFAKFEKKKSVHLEDWPSVIKISEKKNDEEVWNKLIETIGKVRQAKSEAKKAMNAEIILTLPSAEMKLLQEVLDDLRGVTTAREIKEGKFKVEFV